MDHKPDELSGEENQRVAVAWALSCPPAIVLGDEPQVTSIRNCNRINELLKKLNREYNQTFIVVTHNRTWPKI